MRRAAKTDANQQAIVERLRAIGARVFYVKEPVDLLVGYRNATVLLECKAPGGRITKAQAEFIAQWNGGALHVVRDPDEAVNLVLQECK